MSPREAAWTVRHKTGTAITPCTLHERSGDVSRWVVRSPFAHTPSILDDDQLIAFAAGLDATENADRARDRDFTTVV